MNRRPTTIFSHFRRFSKLITLVLMPFMMVFANSAAVATLIYEWEWEDIITHHYQHLNPLDADSKERGAGFIHAALEKSDTQHPTNLPKPPATVPEVRAILTNTQVPLPELFSAPSLFSYTPEGTIIAGFDQDVFHPPCLPVYSEIH